MSYLRKNAWNNGGTFDNPDLLWYAKGVGVMQSRSLSDENSWWFFAAIHGEYLDRPTMPGWSKIPGPPTVPTSPRPSQSVQDQYWNQCQHQTWFFPPWHRGYLLALESQIRNEIVALGGPEDWALPYWNYLGPDDQNKIPPAFTATTLPDGTANPLFVEARYGPNNDGNIYVPHGSISNACQTEKVYTGQRLSKKVGYGGYKTGFNHSGGSSGKLENNPHNFVHGIVGGDGGVMSYPGSAALDPIFYFHHANIDRMWADWNLMGNANPTDQDWLLGPASTGEREFVMPLPGGSAWTFTPEQMNSLDLVGYSYEETEAPLALETFSTLASRMNKLGVPLPEAKLSSIQSNLQTASEVVGASLGAHDLQGSGMTANVRLDKSSWQNVPQSLMKVSETNVPDLVFLQIENVKGNNDGNILNVSINDKPAGQISLFGLLDATDKNGHHGGSGLTFTIDITDIIDDLHLSDDLDVDDLDVKIHPNRAIKDDNKMTIGRLSIHREQH